MRILHVLIFAAFQLLTVAGASAQNAGWVEEKCSLYAQAWSRSIETVGDSGPSASFRSANELFIDSGCVRRDDICPVSKADLDIANMMSLVMINEGAASTFLPYRCPTPKTSPGGWTGPGL